MAFRTVVINTHSKLEYSLSYLVFRTPETTKKIHLDEVHTLIVESDAVSLTTSLLIELSKRKIKVIFCDEKHNPSAELMPCYGNGNSSKRIKEQMAWKEDVSAGVWQQIIQRKIQNQATYLSKRGSQEAAAMLFGFAKEVAPGDPTNREGHAAKVYFNRAFFEGFTREADCFLNACLNYGYTLLLSEFNRAIVAAGYLTQLGIHHKNEFNDFNLSCDFVEPFRFLVDEKAASLKEGDDFKAAMKGLLGEDVVQLGKTQTVANAINIYVSSLFTAIETGDLGKIAFLDYELGR